MSTSAPPLLSLQREQELRGFGYTRIAGVDEAGRGPLAGPVVAAAIVLPDDAHFPHEKYSRLNDSKKLTDATREALFAMLTSTFEFGIGVVEAAIIDEINIRQATWRAMQLAVEALPSPADYVLIDGLEYGPGPWPYEAVVKGDATSLSIAAASVIAKVTRDRLMQEHDRKHPEYGFARHKGYGTAAHLEALKTHGPCPLHRKTFAPVQRLLEGF